MTTLLFTRMYPDVKAPRLGTPNSVGADIHAYCKTESGRPSKVMIPAKATRPIPTGLIVAQETIMTTAEVSDFPGIATAVPVDPPHTILVCSRSGMAKEKSLFVTNSPGVIDPDYRGEVFVLLYNGGHEAHYVEHGDRIAQLIMVPIPIPQIRESVYNLGEEKTTRGDAGFGSTGR